MATSIKFKNTFGIEITKEQAEGVVQDFAQEQYIDGELKRVDIFEGGILNDGDYYLSPDEDFQTVLNNLKAQWKAGTFLFNKQRVGDYTIWDWEIYRGLDKLEKGKRVFDNLGRLIADQVIDINSLDILYTSKFHYLNNLGSFRDQGDIQDFGTFEFTYNLDYVGQITVDVNLPGFELKSYTITPETNVLNRPLLAPLFSWSAQTYYHNDQLIP